DGRPGYDRSVRCRDRYATEALAAYLSRLSGAPNPEELAAVVGTAVEATGCVVSVAGQHFRWGLGAGQWARYDVEFGGVPQGAISLSPDDIGPLSTLIEALGAPMLAVRLAVETEHYRRAGDLAARELLDHRWRVTVEMEQERRALERDLHDGAQHHLVSLRMMMALAEHSADAIHERLPNLLTRLDTAERVLIDTAAGVLPLALASGGLAAGLEAELAEHSDVSLDLSQLRRTYSSAVEAAVYFACLEAVNNAHKHAPGATIRVTVRDGAHGLEFAVADNGPGFTDAALKSGLLNLRSRIAAVGGQVRIDSSSNGTTISGIVPYGQGAEQSGST